MPNSRSRRARTVGRAVVSADVALLSVRERRLAVLLARGREAGARERWELPWGPVGAGDLPADVAEAAAREALGGAPGWLEQVRVFGGKRRHPGDADLSIGWVGLVPGTVELGQPDAAAWFPTDELPTIPPRHREVIDAALEAVRGWVDASPVAFRLLPATFTLSQLQEIYELLLGHRLHKASFRRALQGAALVEPTREWRSEGRGRPAQLYRFAPRRRRRQPRGVRFDLLRGEG